MLLSLPLDIKVIIALKCPTNRAWYLFYRYDREFAQYSQTAAAKSAYISAFTEIRKHKGKTMYMIHRRIHREGDQPAYIKKNGTLVWYRNGKIHRDNNPAIITIKGDHHWYQNGIIHRESDLPPIVLHTGEKRWDKAGLRYEDSIGNKFWKNKQGRYHREDGPAIILVDGSDAWYIDGKLHRPFGLPAKTRTNGNQTWSENGQYHREGDLPARITSSGDQYWRIRDKLHRDNDKPASVLANGDQYWYQNGKLHRSSSSFDVKTGTMVDNPAIVKTNGELAWYQHGELHRINNPAHILADGSQHWYLHGKRHRVNGPAVICADDEKEWWINGEKLSKYDYTPYWLFYT